MLFCIGHALMGNRDELMVQGNLTQTNGNAERRAVRDIIQRHSCGPPRRGGYDLSIRLCKRIKEAFGWSNTIEGWLDSPLQRRKGALPFRADNSPQQPHPAAETTGCGTMKNLAGYTHRQHQRQRDRTEKPRSKKIFPARRLFQ
ncbi:hypothetical protein [Paracoccus albus]|uniref:hypothetical protein n=1 Tax=Paracoccus albus TaxID=3017784 RepID=UPI0022F06250|nr:hypothetical protein [Paracoccus albus]WBU62006.1 hypothetical protein PAF20_10055 [Paracoccus albus]